MAQNVIINGVRYNGVPSVELPKAGGGTASFVDPTGTKIITANGTHDVAAYAAALVQVPTGAGNCKRFSFTPPNIPVSRVTIVSGDPDIAAHYADENFTGVIKLRDALPEFPTGFNYMLAFEMFGNKIFPRSSTSYASGHVGRMTGNEDYSGATITDQRIQTSVNTALRLGANANGDLTLSCSDSSSVFAANYDVIVWW